MEKDLSLRSKLNEKRTKAYLEIKSRVQQNDDKVKYKKQSVKAKLEQYQKRKALV